MGYRARLGKIAKTEREKIKGKSASEVCKMYDNSENGSPYYPKEHTELYELGKYVAYNENNKFENYYDFDITEEMETEFHIMSKEDLEYIINDYHKKVFENYSFYLKILENKTITEEEKEKFQIYSDDEAECKKVVVNFIKSKVREWENSDSILCPYELDKTKDLIQSWCYEYAIFQLVNIYRNFDWDNDYLIYSAW